jgi:hypothetical protein
METNSVTPHDQRAFNERIIALFERLSVRYGIGGSVAAMSYSKTARFTIDVDFMFDATAATLELFVSEVEKWQVYIDPFETIAEVNLPSRLPINIVDGMTGTKADLFIVHASGLDVSIMNRLRRRKLYVQPDVYAWFMSPEDVILYKLIYFKKSEGASQKHPTDIHAMLRAIYAELDQDYLEKWGQESGVLDLWKAVSDEFHR